MSGRWLLLPRAAGLPDEDVHRRRTAAAGVLASFLILVGLALVLARQLAEFRDPFVPLSEDLSLLMGSAWGTAWYVAAGAALVTLGAFGLAAVGRAAGWWLAALGTGVLGFFPGLTGHAGGVEGPRLLALTADAAHVLAAGGWIGGLAVVLLLEWRARRDGDGSLLPSLVPPFSPLAMTCVAVLAVTGTWGAWLQLPDLASLWTGAYGRLLLLKLAVVAVVLGLGAVNYRRLTPRLGDDAGDRALRRSATLELAVANLVLLVTAVLIRTSPLGH